MAVQTQTDGSRGSYETTCRRSRHGWSRPAIARKAGRPRRSRQTKSSGMRTPRRAANPQSFSGEQQGSRDSEGRQQQRRPKQDLEESTQRKRKESSWFASHPSKDRPGTGSRLRACATGTSARSAALAAASAKTDWRTQLTRAAGESTGQATQAAPTVSGGAPPTASSPPAGPDWRVLFTAPTRVPRRRTPPLRPRRLRQRPNRFSAQTRGSVSPRGWVRQALRL